MMRIIFIIFLLTITCSATIYTVHVNDSPTTIYNTIQNATCGDTVNINAGTYSNANSNIELIYLTGKACTAGNILLIQASNPNNKPLFDYTGTPLDGGGTACGITYPTVIPHSYGGSDFMRGAWQITNSSYVTFDGLLIKGATACGQTSVAGLRINSNGGASLVDHVTVRNSTFQQNWDGMFTNGTNILGEFNVFISNGQPSEDQEHQWYDGAGDQLTIRYNTFLGQGCGGCSLVIGTGPDTCCIKNDGTIQNTGGGQTLHTRSWNQFIYGNWMQDGRDYEWDMSAPDAFYAPGGVVTDMYQSFYGNTVIINVTPVNTAKVMTFTGYVPRAGCDNNPSGVGCPLLTMHLDAQWNTFYHRTGVGSSQKCLGTGTTCFEGDMFQINNYTSSGGTLPQNGSDCVGCDALGGAVLHFVNNILWFAHNTTGSWKHGFITVAGNGNPWTITGNNNYLGAPDQGGVINNCITPISVWNGTCTLTTTTNNVTSSPPFLNLAALNVTPTSSGAFGSSDTTQTLKAPSVAYSPTLYTALSTYTDIGALQFATTPQALQPTCSPGSGFYSSIQIVTCSDLSSGAIMCYTTNGTTPATNGTTGCTTGTLYSSALTLITSLTLKVIAGGTGFSDSTIASYNYTIIIGGTQLTTGSTWPAGATIQ